MQPPASMEHLESGNEALGRRDWEDARAAFKAAIAVEETPEALEGLGWALWWAGEMDLLFTTREHAYRLYRQRGDEQSAGRLAGWISADYIDFKGDLSVASGWRQVAHRHLDPLPPSADHGWLLVNETDAALNAEEDAGKALEGAGRVLSLAREIGDSEIEMVGLAQEGLALVGCGDIDAGMKRLEEAGVLALAGAGDPGAITLTLCYLLFACEYIRDYDRATEWCERMRRFTDEQNVALGQGICRAHYASILIWHGDWERAELELRDAAERYGSSRPPLAAETVVRTADLRLRQGRLEEAEQLFRQIEWHPLALLGLSRISLERGRLKDAKDLVERFLKHSPESSRTQRAPALELLVRIEALLSNPSRAAEVLDAMVALSERIQTAPVRAAVGFARASVAIARRDYEEARSELEDAVALYERCAAPYESARARLELASVLIELGRTERARGEAQSARETLLRLGSLYFAQRATVLLRTLDEAEASGNGVRIAASSLLTDRQVEVLRLISRGLNDREIAASLVVSEHTVHRHVANILNRLEVPSRAAAVAEASSRGLL